MPDQPFWYSRIPQIVTLLEDSTLPVLDRFSIEHLFGVRRRQALRIMASLGGYQAGRTSLVGRLELIAALRKLLLQNPSAETAVRRKQRIWRILCSEEQHLRAKTVVIPPLGAPRGRLFDNLPAGVELTRGRLVITYREPVDLLQKLFSLSQAVANDYNAFEVLHLDPDSGGTPHS
jgi:hypothetical protein